MLKVNENAYKTLGKTFTLRVVAKTDPVPGAWDKPEDLMDWICQHSYVQSVELEPQ